MFVPTQHWTKAEKFYPTKIQSDSSMSQGQFPRTTVLNSQKVTQIKMTFSFAHFYNEVAVKTAKMFGMRQIDGRF